jgi:hypothetical protein
VNILIYHSNALIMVGGDNDAPGMKFVPGKGWVPVPGWEVSRLSDLQSAVTVLNEVARFKNPRLIDSVGTQMGAFVHEELTAYLGDAGLGEVSHSTGRESARVT